MPYRPGPGQPCTICSMYQGHPRIKCDQSLQTHANRTKTINIPARTRSVASSSKGSQVGRNAESSLMGPGSRSGSKELYEPTPLPCCVTDSHTEVCYLVEYICSVTNLNVENNYSTARSPHFSRPPAGATGSDIPMSTTIPP